MNRFLFLVLLLSFALATIGQRVSRTVAADVSNDTVTATGSATAIALKNRFAEIVNVMDYGAKGDGATDDTAALSAAQTRASQVGGGILIPCKVRIAGAAGTISAPIQFDVGGSLDIRTSGSVTLTGALLAPLSQIFYANGGTLTFSSQVEAVYPQWWGAKGDGATDDFGAINSAVSAAISCYQRVVGGVGGTFPVKVMTVRFPPGIYKHSQTIEPTNRNYSTCALEGIGVATLLYSGSGAAVYIGNGSTNMMTMPVTIRNLAIHTTQGNKPAGSIGLAVERVSNCVFEGLSFYGFDYAIQNLGGETCLYDFHHRGAIEHCNTGILVQQATSGGVMKPNLTTIRNGYFIDCSSNAVVIRRNPDESPINNGSGGVVSIMDCNFQSGSSGAAVCIDTPGEVPGKGAVEISRSWFEGYGPTAIQLTAGSATLRHCMIVEGATPILLMDTTSRVSLEQLESYFGTAPTANAIVSRYDGTAAGIASQINSIGTKIQAYNCTVYLTAGNLVPLDAMCLGALSGATVTTKDGITSSLSQNGYSDVLDLSGGGVWFVTCKQSDGGSAWRATALVVSNGLALNVTYLEQTNVNITGSGAYVRLTNTNPFPMALSWTALRFQ